MFGDNPIRSQELDPNVIALQEHFLTIQGEGPQSGRRALFLRLAGCNLACWFCDTEFESGMSNSYRAETLVEELQQRYSPEQREFIVLTGGEPLRQDVTLLLALLFSTGTKLVQVETAGTLWVPGLERYIDNELVQLVCSPKTPRIHLNVAVYCKHWKYVIRADDVNKTDGLPARGTGLATRDKVLQLFRPSSVRNAYVEDHEPRDETVWLSPMDEQDPVKNKRNMDACVEQCLKHGYRLSLQTHKIIGVA